MSVELVQPILVVLYDVLELYKWVIVVTAVMSWLIAFNVVNVRHEFVRAIWTTLVGVTEPALRPIRRLLPRTGGVDISPVILFFIIVLIQLYLAKLIQPSF
jgi:YggT family protein